MRSFPVSALQELWDLMSVAENVLRVVSSMVVVTRAARDADGHPLQPRSEAAGDGGAQIRGRAAPARLRAVHERGGGLALLGAAAGVALLYVALLIGQPIVARESTPAASEATVAAWKPHSVPTTPWDYTGSDPMRWDGFDAHHQRP